MSRLITFGCSFSYGQGLDPNEVCATEPHPDAWPYQLGKLLGVEEVLNFASPGQSNKFIWYISSCIQFKDDDIVIFQWSFPDRDFVVTEHLPFKTTFEKKHHQDIWHDFRGKSFAPWINDNGMEEHYVKSGRHTHLDSWIQTALYIDHADLNLKRTTNNVYHVSAPENFYETLMIPKFKSLQNSLVYNQQIPKNDDVALPDFSLKNPKLIATMSPELNIYGPCSDTDGHLTLKGNTAFAERLHSLI